MRGTCWSRWTLVGHVSICRTAAGNVADRGSAVTQHGWGCSGTPGPAPLLSAERCGGHCAVTGTEIAVPSAQDLMSKSCRTADRPRSCWAAPLLAAEGPRQTTNCSHLPRRQEEIDQTNRQFSLINRMSFYTCRLVTFKHDGNSVLAEQQKNNHTCFHQPVKTLGAGTALAWTLACHLPYKSLRCCALFLRVMKGTICSCFADFFP